MGTTARAYMPMANGHLEMFLQRSYFTITLDDNSYVFMQKYLKQCWTEVPNVVESCLSI